MDDGVSLLTLRVPPRVPPRGTRNGRPGPYLTRLRQPTPLVARRAAIGRFGPCNILAPVVLLCSSIAGTGGTCCD